MNIPLSRLSKRLRRCCNWRTKAASMADSIAIPRWRPAPQKHWDLPRICRRSCDEQKAGCLPWTPVRTANYREEKKTTTQHEITTIINHRDNFPKYTHRHTQHNNENIQNKMIGCVILLPGSCDVYDREAVIWRCDTSAACLRSPELKPIGEGERERKQQWVQRNKSIWMIPNHERFETVKGEWKKHRDFYFFVSIFSLLLLSVFSFFRLFYCVFFSFHLWLEVRRGNEEVEEGGRGDLGLYGMEPKNNSMTHSKKQTTHRKIERNGSIVVLTYKTPGKKKKKRESRKFKQKKNIYKVERELPRYIVSTEIDIDWRWK